LTAATTASSGQYELSSAGVAAVAALFAAAIGLRWWAIRVLGRFFTVDVTLQKDHAVVTSGPYAYVRHPSYTGALLAFVALGASFGSWWSVPLLLLPIVPAFAYRIFVEEAALTRGLGEPYRRYCERTWRLIPWVW
jgi:protein-S-isoprenylcysteine O-methyltransferase